jgi:hypothetical protein
MTQISLNARAIKAALPSTVHPSQRLIAFLRATTKTDTSPINSECIEKGLNDAQWQDDLIEVTCFDADLARLVVDRAASEGFKGLFVFNGIYRNQGMVSFWRSLTQRKIDATFYGDVSDTGIGIVVNDRSRIDVTTEFEGVEYI